MVPADQPATARMACNVPADVELVYGMSHMHRRGGGYRAWLDGAALPQPVELFTTTE